MKQLSKFLSYVLRHRPDSIGITLDKNGWADVDELIQKADQPITLDELVEVTRSNDKQRFTLDLDNNRIRANQGHSINVDLELKPKIPPIILYHGTVGKFMVSILKEGLKPMSRQHVHLSADKATATNVGSRRGQPTILEIDTRELVKNGHKFYLSENGVWLTDFIPPSAIKRL